MTFFLRILKLLVPVSVLLFGSPAIAQQDDASNDSCGFVNSLVSGEGGVDFLESLAANSPMWSDSARGKLRPALEKLFNRFEYQDGSVFTIADLGNVSREQLVAMRLKTGGTVYFRMLYEWDGSRLSFINIKMQADYYDIIKPGGIVGYEPVDCG